MIELVLLVLLAELPPGRCDGDAPLTPCETALLDRLELEHRDARVAAIRLEGCQARLAARSATTAVPRTPGELASPAEPEVPGSVLALLGGLAGALAGLVAGILIAR